MTTVLGGTLILDQAGVTEIGTVIVGDITINGGTLQLKDRVQVIDELTLTSGSITVSASGNGLIARTYLLNPTSGTTHAINADLGDKYGSTLTMSGSSGTVVTLNGSNSYIGKTTINGGT